MQHKITQKKQIDIKKNQATGKPQVMTREHRKSKQNRAKGKKEKSTQEEVKEQKNALKHLTIFYQNIKGMKSKLDSLTKSMDDTNPTIKCILETHMLTEEQITIPGFERVFREDGITNSGGIMIAVKNNIKKI